jgi:hypothetical protein
VSPAAAALVLALVDLETPLWLDPPAASDEVRAFLRFHCGALLAAELDGARFALVTDPARMPSLGSFDAGQLESWAVTTPTAASNTSSAAPVRRNVRMSALLVQMVVPLMRAETTSMAMTMATMSRITVAASRSLKDRMVSQR